MRRLSNPFRRLEPMEGRKPRGSEKGGSDLELRRPLEGFLVEVRVYERDRLRWFVDFFFVGLDVLQRVYYFLFSYEGVSRILLS